MKLDYLTNYVAIIYNNEESQKRNEKQRTEYVTKSTNDSMRCKGIVRKAWEKIFLSLPLFLLHNFLNG